MTRKKFPLPGFGLGIAAMFALASPAQAFQRIDVTNAVDVEKVEIDSDGQRKVRFTQPTTVVPGDRLRFTLRVQNNSSEPADGMTLANPIPSAVRFVDTADRAGFAVSVDGGKSFGDLAELTIVSAQTPRPATADDVTHVRWILPEPLAPGAIKTVTFIGLVR